MGKHVSLKFNNTHKQIAPRILIGESHGLQSEHLNCKRNCCNGHVKFKPYLYWFNCTCIVSANIAVNYTRWMLLYSSFVKKVLFAFARIKKGRIKANIHSIKWWNCSVRSLPKLMCPIRIYAHFQLHFANTKTTAIQTIVFTIFFFLSSQCSF